MRQLQKLEGIGNVQMVETDTPSPGPHEVQVKLAHSLISRGSELFYRYVKEEALDPVIMGYSDAGTVSDIGAEVAGFAVGDRVMALGPHAQYVSRPEDQCYILPAALSTEVATFMPLANGALTWSQETPIDPGDTVVVLGQGLVGNMYAQAVRRRDPGRVIVVDATEKRCAIAADCGTESVVNAAEADPVEAILDLTGGEGAEVVVECVGGNAGVNAFTQAQQMLRRGGVIHLISKYAAGDGVAGSGVVPLDTSGMQGKRIVIGHWQISDVYSYIGETVQMLIDRRIDVEPLITHRMSWDRTPEAYHLLFNSPGDALGVVIEWE